MSISQWSCAVDVANSAFVIDAVLFDTYSYKAGEWIEFSIDAIEMPSSIRPTGSYRLEFFDKIGEEYKLVDTTEVTDMLRALSGGLVKVDVAPQPGTIFTTFTSETMTFSFIPGHKILQGGYVTIIMPPELKFEAGYACTGFSQNIDQDA